MNSSTHWVSQQYIGVNLDPNLNQQHSTDLQLIFRHTWYLACLHWSSVKCNDAGTHWHPAQGAWRLKHQPMTLSLWSMPALGADIIDDDSLPLSVNNGNDSVMMHILRRVFNFSLRHYSPGAGQVWVPRLQPCEGLVGKEDFFARFQMTNFSSRKWNCDGWYKFVAFPPRVPPRTKTQQVTRQPLTWSRHIDKKLFLLAHHCTNLISSINLQQKISGLEFNQFKSGTPFGPGPPSYLAS